MKRLAALLGAVAPVGLGVGGTLTIQHFSGGQSRDCRIASNMATGYLLWVEQGNKLDATQIDTLDKALDIRWKACHP